MYNHEPFSIDANIRDSLCKFCPLDKADCENCSARTKNEVDGKILTELRWHVITYLNMLETVMVSWDLGVVDKEMIEEQFLFIKKGQALSQFRQSAGGYPTIEKFLRKISPAAESKKPL